MRFLPVNFYKVDDGTGEVTVMGREGRTPPRGAHVRVKGKVNDLATFGGASLGLHLQETDPRRSGGDPHRDRRHVVVRRRAVPPLIDGVEDRLDDLRRRQLA